MSVAKINTIPIVKTDGKMGTLTTITNVDPKKYKLVKKGILWKSLESWFWRFFGLWTYTLGDANLMRSLIWISIYLLLHFEVLKYVKARGRMLLYSAAFCTILFFIYKNKPEVRSYYATELFGYRIYAEKLQK